MRLLLSLCVLFTLATIVDAGLHDLVKEKAEDAISKHLGELKGIFHHSDHEHRAKRGIARKIVEYKAQRLVRKQIEKMKDKVRPSKSDKHHRDKRGMIGDMVKAKAQELIQKRIAKLQQKTQLLGGGSGKSRTERDAGDLQLASAKQKTPNAQNMDSPQVRKHREVSQDQQNAIRHEIQTKLHDKMSQAIQAHIAEEKKSRNGRDASQIIGGTQKSANAQNTDVPQESRKKRSDQDQLDKTRQVVQFNAMVKNIAAGGKKG